MNLNGISVVERHNRPGVMKKVLLRCDFISNGAYTDPYDISSVSFFRKTQNTSPSTVLVTSSQLISDTAASTVKFRWVKDGGGNYATDSNYEDASAIRIIKFDTGRYGVVLDGVNNPTFEDRNGDTLDNGASAAGEYIDVWTVKMSSQSDYQVFINDSELFSDGFIAVTQPIMLKMKNHLHPNIVRLGETVDLKVTTDITIANRDIDQDIKNIFSQSVVDEPKFRILKHNEDTNLPARVEVSGYTQTSSLIRTTSDNTMLLQFSPPPADTTDLGSVTGTYSVEAQYTVLTETKISPMMYFTVR